MNDSATVGIFDGLTHAADQLCRRAWRQRSLGKPLGQALSFHEPHREIVLALVQSNLEDRDNAGMVEIGSGFGLGVKAPDVRLVRELAGQDHLECHRPVEAPLDALEDDAHPAGTISRTIS